MRDRIDKKGLIEGCLQKRREKKEKRKKRYGQMNKVSFRVYVQLS